MRKLDKKGIQALQGYASAAIIFVVVAVVLVVGARVLDQLDNNLTGEALNAAQNGTAAISELTSWLPTSAIVVAASIIISLVAGALLVFRFGGRN
jgi:hypothetical protein|tara:strand:+ start:191 stop:475 length:285 start_codon:yes stop_codon:yes gene_type:complete